MIVFFSFLCFFLSLAHPESPSTLAVLNMLSLRENSSWNFHQPALSSFPPFLFNIQCIKMSRGQLQLDEIPNHYSVQITALWYIEHCFQLWLSVCRAHPEPHYEREHKCPSFHNLTSSFRKLVRLE